MWTIYFESYEYMKLSYGGFVVSYMKKRKVGELPGSRLEKCLLTLLILAMPFLLYMCLLYLFFLMANCI